MKGSVDPKIQFNRPLLPFLLGLLVLLQLVAPYQGWLVLLVGLGGGWLVGALWAWSLARGLHLRREVRFGWAQVGDRLEEQFVLANRSWLRGLGAEVLDYSNLPDYQASRLLSVDGHGQRSWRTQGLCVRRGLFTLGPTRVRVGDPLGFYTVTADYLETTTLMVTPRIVQLPAIQVAPGGRAGEGRLRANTLEPTVSAAGVRDYTPGDPAHVIHWPTSARRNALYVRFFDSTPAGDWWIILDLDRRAQRGEDHHSTEEHGIILAASLADRGLKMGRAVGLVAQGTELAWLPPQLGDQQRWQILRALAMIEPGQATLNDLLSRVRSSIGQFSSLIIITPAVDDRWVTTLLTFLRRGVVPTVLLLDPRSFGNLQRPEETADLLQTQLSRLGIPYYMITRALLDQ